MGQPPVASRSLPPVKASRRECSFGYGYDPSLSEGSVKPPVFLTSTFVFQTAEQGRDFFDYAHTSNGDGTGLIPSTPFTPPTAPPTAAGDSTKWTGGGIAFAINAAPRPAGALDTRPLEHAGGDH
jgi:hypothetical protein